MIFKVLRGIHQDKFATPVSLVEIEGINRGRDEAGNLVVNHNTYYAGDVIEHDRDLVKLMPGRFERMEEHQPINAPAGDAGQSPKDAVSEMSVAEMKDLASREEIDLGEATLKVDIARILRAGLVDKLASV